MISTRKLKLIVLITRAMLRDDALAIRVYRTEFNSTPYESA